MQSTPATWKAWGEGTLEAIRRELYLPEGKLYAEDDSRERPAYNWPAGVMLSALAAGARANPKFKPWLREYADAMRAYWHEGGGFDVYPLPKPTDRYYDDNAWMALALIETSEVLQDKSYLDWAEQTIRFVLTGEDAKLGGGIYWRENEKTSKNTCANAPTALALLRLGAKTGDKRLVAHARRIFSWTRATLQDPGTSLYWDNIDLSGKIEKTTWSYNTAVMIKAGRLLEALAPDFKASPDPTPAATRHWLDPSTGLIKDDLAFAHMLFEALIEGGFRDAGRYLTGLHDKVRDAKGHYGKRWDDVAKSPRSHFRLIDQASAARAYFAAYNASAK